MFPDEKFEAEAVKHGNDRALYNWQLRMFRHPSIADPFDSPFTLLQVSDLSLEFVKISIPLLSRRYNCPKNILQDGFNGLQVPGNILIEQSMLKNRPLGLTFLRHEEYHRAVALHPREPELSLAFKEAWEVLMRVGKQIPLPAEIAQHFDERFFDIRSLAGFSLCLAERTIGKSIYAPSELFVRVTEPVPPQSIAHLSLIRHDTTLRCVLGSLVIEVLKLLDSQGNNTEANCIRLAINNMKELTAPVEREMAANIESLDAFWGK